MCKLESEYIIIVYVKKEELSVTQRFQNERK